MVLKYVVSVSLSCSKIKKMKVEIEFNSILPTCYFNWTELL